MTFASRFFGFVELDPEGPTVVNGKFMLNGRACSTELWIERAFRERPDELSQAEALLGRLEELDRAARAALANEKEEVPEYFRFVIERGREHLIERIGPDLSHENLMEDLRFTGVGAYCDKNGLRLELDYANILPSGNAALVVQIDREGQISAIDRNI